MPWGSRSIPEIDGRNPLWDQPNFVRDVEQGRFFLPDAEELKRETLVTTAVDADPMQCLRVPGPTFLTFWAAVFTGGLFIFGTFHWWWLAAGSGALALGTILVWLWTGTAVIPEKDDKDVGLGVRLPLYASGSASVGWWAMLITMIGDLTAFISLVFGYFFYWTLDGAFPPAGFRSPDPGDGGVAVGFLLASWAVTIGFRQVNRRAGRAVVCAGMSIAAALAIAGGFVLVDLPRNSGLDPTTHAYAATVWVLVLWTVAHVGVGVIAQLYCAARALARRLTPRHDIDLVNAGLYWHFLVATAVITAGVICGFPLLDGGAR
jgi:cytochrome c oxidase subunit I+III